MVPLAINLREHWGALYSDEVLERHARSVGFSPKETLTAAWRAGITHLILDGFDEVATQAIARPSDRNFMINVRYEALQATRDLVSKMPSASGALICGRDHYFDDIMEMQNALGLQGKDFIVISLGEFTEDKVSEFLGKHASTSVLPDWLPRKPLLLGYLAHQKLLEDVLAIDSDKGFGFVWDAFLDLVCEREAQHERAVMDPATIRRVLERLACIARGTNVGTGPLTGIDLAEAFKAETGEIPGEGVLMQLQRLPGLTQREQDPTARSFVDTDMLGALQGSAVARMILESDFSLADRKWIAELPRNGVQMAAYLLDYKEFTSSGAIDFSRRILRDESKNKELEQLATDSFVVGVELVQETQLADGKGIVVTNGNIFTLDLEGKVVANTTFRGCSIEELYIGEQIHAMSVRFEGCVIMDMNGSPSEDGLPEGMFSSCEFGEFDDASTNSARV